MKRWMSAQPKLEWVASGLVLIVALAAFVGISIGPPSLLADNSYKRIIMRGKLLSSIGWSAAGSTETVGSLFSTAAYDTADYPNDRPDQSRSMRGPLVCWARLDQIASAGVGTNNGANVSVFIQHAPNNVEGEWTNLMYLSSENRLAATPNNGLARGRSTLDSQMNTTDSLAMAVTTDGAFGRYLRARFILTGAGSLTPGINRNEGFRAWVHCDQSGDSRIQ